MKGMTLLNPFGPEIINELKAYPNPKIQGKNTVMSFYLISISYHQFTQTIGLFGNCAEIQQKYF
jgi:hypothetical protein